MKTVAVLGASNDRRKFGNKCVRAYAEEGWTVVPIHPRETSIEGHPCVPKPAALETAPDRLSVYLPPRLTAELLAEIAAVGARDVWFNPGSATPEILEQARELEIPAVDGCSIVDIGRSPAEFP